MVNTIRLDLFDANIEQLPQKMIEGANEGINQAAELILALAQLNVRVDRGTLRDSGRIEREGNKVIVKFGNAQVNYARIIEERYPYLRPAVAAVYPQIKALIERGVMEKVG